MELVNNSKVVEPVQQIPACKARCYNISNIKKRYAIFVLLSCEEYSETLNQKPKIYFEVVFNAYFSKFLQEAYIS